LLIKT